MTMTERPAVDVVIPFAGSAEELDDLLDRCNRLALGSADTLVVVDNRPSGEPSRSSGGAARVVAAREARGSYLARNRGAAAGNHEWLVFIDADVDPPPDLLDRYFDSQPGDATGVLVGAVEDERPSGERETAVARFLFERASMSQANTAEQADQTWAYAQTANCAVRRSAFEAVGGFREDVRSGGDADLCFRLRRGGWALEARDGARVVHRNRTTVRAMVRQRARHGSGAAWLNRAHPGSVPPSPRLGLARWTATRLFVAAGGALRGDLRRAALVSLEPLSSWAFELGRCLSNSTGFEPARQGLRVAVITDQFPVLSETFVVNEIDELARQGHEVVVEATGRPDGDGVVAASPAAYLEDDTIPAKVAALIMLAVRHPRAIFRDCLWRRRWRREEPVRPLRALGPRVRRMRSAGVDHLHVHFAAGAALDTMRIAAIEGLTYSVTAHAYEIFESPTNLAEKLERAAFVTTGCEYNARHLRKLVSPSAAERIHVVVMGVDPGAFLRSTAYPGGRHVVAVGRLVEKKGFAHLIDAVAELEADRPVARLTIVGEGPLRPELTAQIDRLGLGSRVELVGSRSPGEVREILEDADLLAMPSIVATNGDRDSMPVVVKEAMAMEIPVVASDEVGLTELVQPEFGHRVPPDDAGALAAAIAELLDLSAGVRAEMGQAGRRWVLRHCNLRVETAGLAELIAAARP